MSEWAVIAFALMFAAFCIEATLKRMWRRGYRRLAAEREAEVAKMQGVVNRATTSVQLATRALDSVGRTPIDEWPETIEEKR